MTMPEIIIANSGPLITLAKIKRFNLLHTLFGEVLIPRAVLEEVTVRGAGQPASKETVEASWVRVQNVQDGFAVEILTEGLGHGESEAIVLAQELHADWLILDDALARRKAERLGLAVIGTLGVLLVAKHRGILNSVKPVLDDLRRTDFRSSEQVYRAVLAKANEG